MATVIDQLDSLEIGLCMRINNIGKRKWLQQFFAVISKLGDGGFWIAMGSLLIMMQGSDAQMDVLRIALTTVVGLSIYKTLKKRLQRPRPFVNNASIQLGAKPLDQYSLPSGHTMHAVNLTVLFASAEPLLLYAALPFTLLVAASRVILGLHYPSDVVLGASIGLLLSGLALTLV